MLLQKIYDETWKLTKTFHFVGQKVKLCTSLFLFSIFLCVECMHDIFWSFVNLSFFFQIYYEEWCRIFVQWGGSIDENAICFVVCSFLLIFHWFVIWPTLFVHKVKDFLLTVKMSSLQTNWIELKNESLELRKLRKILW